MQIPSEIQTDIYPVMTLYPLIPYFVIGSFFIIVGLLVHDWILERRNK